MAYRFALVGDPVEHSLSPAMHGAALRTIGVDGTYDLIQCDPNGFFDVIEAMRAGAYEGLNVTMPHKRLAVAVSDRLTAEASESDSVNCLMMDDGAVVGHSSDFVAFAESYRQLGTPAEILVVGAGGSANAAIAAFDGQVQVWARRPEQVEALSRRFGSRVRAWSQSGSHSVLVNCTPIGMGGEELPNDLIGDVSGVIDLPYGDRTTPLVAASLASNRPVVDGRRFLALQAVEAFRWWTGHSIDPDSMEEAARNG